MNFQTLCSTSLRMKRTLPSPKQAGQSLVIKNSAPVAHNAKYDTKYNGADNPLIPPGGKHVIKDLKPERGPFTIECGLHPWMNAGVMVFDHPYFAVTDEDGKFEITKAPRGNFNLYIRRVNGAWHGGANWQKVLPALNLTEDEHTLGTIEFQIGTKAE